MATIDRRTDFSILRYANCWEDPLLLLNGLAIKPGDRILSIGSAGDNSFSLLTADPAQVVAVDISRTQLALIALKKAAIQQLDYPDLLGFLGFRTADNRMHLLKSLEGHLSAHDFAFWKAREKLIEAGIVHAGKFERYFQLFSRKVLPWIHRKSTVERLLAPKPAIEQEIFYNRRWNTWRWRLLFKLFFSRLVMGQLGRDPEFMREVDVHVGKTIFEQAQEHLRSPLAQKNFMLRYNLTGDFGELLPHYLLPENYAIIRQRIDRLMLCEGYAEQAIRRYGTFQRMNLSNIFEYMNMDTFTYTAAALIAGLAPCGRMAYWNLLVPRYVSHLANIPLTRLEQLSETLKAADRGFYYRDFIVEEKND